MQYKPPKGLVLELMEALDINPEGYTVDLEGEDVIVMLHHKTHLEVIIRKGVKKEWLSTKKPCSPG